MRVILDSNVLLSALIRRDSVPGRIFEAWHEKRFDLLTHELQLEELRTVTRRPAFRAFFRPAVAGRLINQLRERAEILAYLPPTRRSNDPLDDFLLGICEAGDADYLVSGDKAGLLSLVRHRRTSIVTARRFLDVIGN